MHTLLKFWMYAMPEACVSNLEAYSCIDRTNTEHNTAFNVVDRLYQNVENNAYILTVCDHLCSSGTKAVGTHA
jgi:hypothetical protein